MQYTVVSRVYKKETTVLLDPLHFENLKPRLKGCIERVCEGIDSQLRQKGNYISFVYLDFCLEADDMGQCQCQIIERWGYKL